MQNFTTFVSDIGVSSTKMGFGGDSMPLLVCPSKVVSPCTMEDEKKIIAGSNTCFVDKTDLQIESIFDFQQQNQVPVLKQSYFQCFVDGFIKNELKVELSNYSFLFAEDASLSKKECFERRKTIAGTLFNKFNVPNVFFLKNAVLDAFATGRSTALVVDSGQLSTKVVTVHDGFVLQKSTKILPFGGLTIDTQIQRYLTKNKINFHTRYELQGKKYTKSFLDFHRTQLIRDIKEHFSTGENSSNQKTLYELPDRNIITINKSQINNPLINNHGSWNQILHSYDYQNLGKTISDTIEANDVEIRKELASNLILGGGNMIFSDTFSRVLSEVVDCYSRSSYKVKTIKILNNTEKKSLSWIGGSLVTGLSAFQSYWIGKGEYHEIGDSVLERKHI